MEGKPLIRALLDLQLRDLVALLAIILFVAAIAVGSAELGDLIQAADLEDTWNCPLARLVRKRLHGRGIHRGITCIFTPEPCRNDLPPRPEDIDAHVGPGRKRTPLGTLSYMPALVGLRVAEEVIRRLLGAQG